RQILVSQPDKVQSSRNLNTSVLVEFAFSHNMLCKSAFLLFANLTLFADLTSIIKIIDYDVLL
ncbi:MAG: hypothetical protein IJM41_05990, partial [Bacteroidales bacterium]|nr:hypothetical protein [Bacteroidales bacterium]